MSEHLPECLMNLEYAVRVCICPELRVCEKRVLDAIDLPAANVQYHRVGFKEGLNAAREAVAALSEVAGWTGELAIIRKPIALDAIDALKEKP